MHTASRLSRDDYHEHFNRTLTTGVRRLRKLELGQHFTEPGFPSWEAFNAGHWDLALTLITEQRPAYTRHHQRMTRLGIRRQRLRLVDRPVTPYVQWECHVLRERERCGDEIRVMDTRTMGDHVRLPECVLLGSAALYHVLYTDQGRADGATLHTAPHLIRAAVDGFDLLWEKGEPLTGFFEREIAPLPAPAVPA